MFTKILSALTNQKNENRPSEKYAFEVKLPFSSLSIQVDGVGQLKLPIEKNTITSLLRLTSLAKFGWRESTLEDTQVRNTYEITADKLSVSLKDNSLPDLLEKMRLGLGLPEGVRLSAQLHNLLIYEPGQFFKRHQDTEKQKGMVATLVIVLPSPHIGGDLIIQHQGREHRFTSENLTTDHLHCVAFYADCHHEVKPIKQGHRLVLTYNIILNSADVETFKSQFNNPALEEALHEFFSVNTSIDSDEPFPFVYFLDHEYSEQGLSWHCLKGADFSRACQFLHAAHALNLKPHLALVELHECWSIQDDQYEPDLEELLQSDISLNYWIDENNNALPYGGYSLSEGSFCYTTETKESFAPYDTQYEGWMGNYGNTADFWYRRAAVVLWPKEQQNTMAFLLNYDDALEALIKLTETKGKEDQVGFIIKKVGHYIHGSQYSTKATDLLSLMILADYVNAPETARLLLEPFNLAMLETIHLPQWRALQTNYGVDWCLQQMSSWEENHHHDIPLLVSFVEFIRQAITIHLDERLCLFLVDYQFRALIEKDKTLLACSRRQWMASGNERIKLSVDFLSACFLVKSSNQKAKNWLKHLMSQKASYDILELLQIHDSLSKEVPVFLVDLFSEFHHYLSGLVSEELCKGLRQPEDWRIGVHLTCSCELCDTAQEFLDSSTQRAIRWPLAQANREHVTRQLYDLDIPLKVSVLKQGRPYQLAITKTDQLFQLVKSRFETLTRFATTKNE